MRQFYLYNEPLNINDVRCSAFNLSWNEWHVMGNLINSGKSKIFFVKLSYYSQEVDNLQVLKRRKQLSTFHTNVVIFLFFLLSTGDFDLKNVLKSTYFFS